MLARRSSFASAIPSFLLLTTALVTSVWLSFCIPLATAFVGPTADFDWELEKRTYVTTDNAANPVLQMPTLDQVPVPRLGGFKSPGALPGIYSRAPIDTPINPQTLNVTFSSLSTPGDGPIFQHSWKIQKLNNGPVVTTGVGNPLSIALPRGAYDVTLFITDTNTLTASIKKTVTVRDILVVSMGDSFSAGEGNPNEPQH